MVVGRPYIPAKPKRPCAFRPVRIIPLFYMLSAEVIGAPTTANTKVQRGLGCCVCVWRYGNLRTTLGCLQRRIIYPSILMLGPACHVLHLNPAV